MPSTTKIPATVVELLQRTVSINSVNSAVSLVPKSETEVSHYLDGLASAMGFATRRLPVPNQCDNLLVIHQVDAKLPWLMFESHLDTVSVEGMTIAPFSAEIRDGKLWGRGSCDTKGTGAAMLWALMQYAKSNKQPSNIVIAFTVDEEISMQGVMALSKAWPDLGFSPRGVIVGEPTLLQPVTAHNGVVRFSVTTHGRAAHSSDPSKGRSAIGDMVRVIDAIESQYIAKLDARHPMTGKAQCSINLISGGSQINIIPASCRIDADRRIAPGEDPALVIPQIADVIARLALTVPGLSAKPDLLFSAPPLEPNRNGQLLAHLQQSLAPFNLDLTPQGKAYATDAGELSSHNIPAIVIGPGDMAMAHTKDEYIVIDQLHRGVEAYLAMMQHPLVG